MAARLSASCAVIGSAAVTDVTANDVRELAQLARLALTDDEVERMRSEFGEILDLITTLRTVDVTGVDEYLSQDQPDSSLRDDSVGPELCPADALASVPRVRDGMVEVPKFKED